MQNPWCRYPGKSSHFYEGRWLRVHSATRGVNFSVSNITCRQSGVALKRKWARRSRPVARVSMTSKKPVWRVRHSSASCDPSLPQRWGTADAEVRSPLPRSVPTFQPGVRQNIGIRDRNTYTECFTCWSYSDCLIPAFPVHSSSFKPKPPQA